MSKEEWEEIRNQIIDRDKRKCFRCDMRFKKIDLSVHHIMPRRLGGGDNPSNLITLCSPCHDIVEMDELFTKTEIIGSYSDNVLERGKNKENKSDDKPLKEESFNRPEWHKYVYGGVRH